MSQQTSSTVSTPNGSGGVAQQNAGVGGIIGSMTPLLLMLFAFYFLLMRPQQKREAKRREMIKAISRGDKVVLTSGIIGTVSKTIGDTQVSLEVAENVRVKVLKNAISEILGKGALFDDDEDNKGGKNQKKKHKQGKNESSGGAEKSKADEESEKYVRIIESEAS